MTTKQVIDNLIALKRKLNLPSLSIIEYAISV